MAIDYITGIMKGIVNCNLNSRVGFNGIIRKIYYSTKVQNAPDFIRAKNVLFKIAMDIKESVLTVTSTLRAVFLGHIARLWSD